MYLKIIKRAIVIVFLSILSIMTPMSLTDHSNIIVNAASKVQLNKIAVSIYVGKTYNLKLSGTKDNIKWSSSDKKIATVNSSGKVKGIKQGKVTITAKVGKNTYKCIVKVEKIKIDAKVKNINSYYDTKMLIQVIEKEKNEKLSVKVSDKKIISCELGEWVGDEQILNIEVKGEGIATITITSSHSSQELVITVNTNKSISYKNEKTYSATQIYNLCAPSTVQINTDIAIGSGFYIDNGIIVTNYHVIKGANKISILNYDGKTIGVDKILGFDVALDIAILSVNTKNDYLPINKHGVTVGEEIYAIGSSLGLTDTFTNGIVTNSYRYIEGSTFIQMNASISEGNSGGPLVNKYGEVMGINTSTYVNGQNLNLALEINQIYQISLNNPLSVDEFSNIKTSSGMVVVKENEEYTKDESSGQKISINEMIEGKMKAGGEYDFYKIEIKESGYYSSAIADELILEYETDLLILFFNEKDEHIEPYSRGYSENVFSQIHYLTPGTYYVVIAPSDNYYNYTYTDIIYYFNIMLYKQE